MFRNSLIFHHLDKLTDLVIHLLPLVTVWNIHWNIRDTPERKEWGFLDPNEIQFDFQFAKELFIAFNLIYVLWAVVYYSIILVIKRKRIEEKNYWTLIQMQVDLNKRATELKKTYGLWAAALFFGSKHYFYAMALGVLGLPGLFYRPYLFVQLVVYLFVVVKNGADYYIEYFSRKYELGLQELDKIAQAKEAEASPDKVEKELKANLK